MNQFRYGEILVPASVVRNRTREPEASQPVDGGQLLSENPRQELYFRPRLECGKISIRFCREALYEPIRGNVAFVNVTAPRGSFLFGERGFPLRRQRASEIRFHFGYDARRTSFRRLPSCGFRNVSRHLVRFSRRNNRGNPKLSHEDNRSYGIGNARLEWRIRSWRNRRTFVIPFR